MQQVAGMLDRLNELWQELKIAPPGERFQRMYTTYAEHDSALLKELLLMAALGCFTIGLVFTFAAAGPAFLFYGLALALLATQSRWLARHADHIELAVRGMTGRLPTRNDDEFVVVEQRNSRLPGMSTVSRMPR